LELQRKNIQGWVRDLGCGQGKVVQATSIGSVASTSSEKVYMNCVLEKGGKKTSPSTARWMIER
jgi:hypothetical protein